MFWRCRRPGKHDEERQNDTAHLRKFIETSVDNAQLAERDVQQKMFPFDADAHRWMPHATNGNIDTNDNFLLKLRFTDGLGWPVTSGHLEPFESRESWKNRLLRQAGHEMSTSVNFLCVKVAGTPLMTLMTMHPYFGKREGSPSPYT